MVVVKSMELQLLFLVALLPAHHAGATNFTLEANEDTNVMIEAANTTKLKTDRGCKLIAPKAVLERFEPEQEPLVVTASFLWLKMRDASNKGGSFGVEFR